MTRNFRGGKKAKKASRFKTNQMASAKRETTLLIASDETQVYGQVIRILGDCRCEVLSLDKQRSWIGHIRGSMKKRCWIRTGDYVLCSIREFQTSKCDILHRYSTQEEADLLSMISSSPMIPEDEDDDFFGSDPETPNILESEQ